MDFDEFVDFLSTIADELRYARIDRVRRIAGELERAIERYQSYEQDEDDFFADQWQQLEEARRAYDCNS